MVDRNVIREIVQEIYDKDAKNIEEVVSEYIRRQGITNVSDRLKRLITSVAEKEIKN